MLNNSVIELESSSRSRENLVCHFSNVIIHIEKIKMGLKALVDYSLIKELCDGKIKCSKHNFTGKVKLKKNQDETKTEDKVNKIKRLLLPSNRENEIPSKKSKKSAKNSSKNSKKSSPEYSFSSSDESISELPDSSIDSSKSGSGESGTSASGSSSEVSEPE